MEQFQHASELKGKPPVRYGHEPKVVVKKRREGRIFYVEFCQNGGAYDRLDIEMCRCPGKPSKSRPCEHMLLAQSKVKEYCPASAGKKTANPLLADLFRLYNEEHSGGQLDPATLRLYKYGQNYLQEFLTLNNAGSRASDLDPKLLVRFKLWLRNQKKYSEGYTALLLCGLPTGFTVTMLVVVWLAKSVATTVADALLFSSIHAANAGGVVSSVSA